MPRDWDTINSLKDDKQRKLEEAPPLKTNIASLKAEIRTKYDILNEMTGRGMGSARASLKQEIEGLKLELQWEKEALDEVYREANAIQDLINFHFH